MLANSSVSSLRPLKWPAELAFASFKKASAPAGMTTRSSETMGASREARKVWPVVFCAESILSMVRTVTTVLAGISTVRVRGCGGGAGAGSGEAARSTELDGFAGARSGAGSGCEVLGSRRGLERSRFGSGAGAGAGCSAGRSEEHTSELQSHVNLVCRLLLEKKKKISK